MVDCQTDNHSRVVKGPEGEKPPKHDTNMKKKERDRTGTYTKFDGDDECLNYVGFVFWIGDKCTNGTSNNVL